MTIDNTTYNFCIESLRYIHAILGYGTIIQELDFIQHLRAPITPKISTEYVADTVTNLDYNINECTSESESDNICDNNEHKNIVIDTVKCKSRYVRAEIPDEKRCEFILPTNSRCTFKKAGTTLICRRHTK